MLFKLIKRIMKNNVMARIYNRLANNIKIQSEGNIIDFQGDGLLTKCKIKIIGKYDHY